MRRSLHIILAALAVAVALLSCTRARVIPRRTFVKIYADMFLADEWVKDNPSVRRQIDTSLLYETIFESYGYTTDDYLKSVEHYMSDTERYARMIKKAADILKDRGAAIRRLDESIRLHDERLREIGKRREVMMRKFSPDSVWRGGYLLQVDSNLEVFFVRRPSDTVYHGPGFTIDTVAVDSTAVDSIAVAADSIAVDTVVKDSPVIDPEVKKAVEKGAAVAREALSKDTVIKTVGNRFIELIR